MKIEEQKHSLIDQLHWHKMNALTAVFDTVPSAHATVEQLADNGFPMERLSVLHIPQDQQSDFLGVSYDDERKRTIVWAENGALWGALTGLVLGASGLVFVPGIGTLMTLGPIIDTIAGATIGSGIMAGAAQLTRLGHGLHQAGIPKEKLEYFQDILMAGKTILILHYYSGDGSVDWQRLINWSNAQSVQLFSA